MKEHIEKKADAMILPHKCLFLLNESHFVAIYKATGLYAVHRQRTCEGYFANSLRPISYLGVIWELYVLGLISGPENNQMLKSMDKGLTVLLFS